MYVSEHIKQEGNKSDNHNSILVEQINSKLNEIGNDWVRTGGWFSSGAILITRNKQAPYEEKDHSKPLPEDTQSLGCGGWDRDGVLRNIHIDLDVGHGTKASEYTVASAALKAARDIRAFVGNAASIRVSKSGHGVHVRIRLARIEALIDGRDVSKKIAWWLKAQLKFRCDHAALSRQCLDFWTRSPVQYSFKEMEPCVGEWTPPLEAITTSYLDSKARCKGTSSSSAAVDEKQFNDVWRGWSIAERQNAYSSYIMAERFPRSVNKDGGSAVMLRVCGLRYAFALSRNDALPVIEKYNEAKCDPAWTDSDIQHKLDDGKYNKAVGTLLRKSFELNDVGNGKRLVDRCGKNIRWCIEHMKWYVWSDNRWKVDRDGSAIIAQAKKARTGIKVDARKAKPEKSREALLKFYNQSGNMSRINQMIKSASSEDGICISARNFDCNKRVLNCKNGTIDLNNTSVRPPTREDYISKIADVHYDPSAKCPLWDDFLNKIFSADQELIGWVQRWCGYCLTANVSERVMVIAFGEGRNGKSTLFETLRRIMGDYSQSANAESLMAKDSGAIRNDIAAWAGSRLLICSESKDRCRLDEAIVKKITGNDTLRARFLYGEEFEFAPTHKVVLYTNHKPLLSGDDKAIWDRVRLLPFEVRISDDEVIKDLPDRLYSEEASGILNWLVEGAKQWSLQGLGRCKRVDDATASYHDECDTVKQFINEVCLVDVTKKVKSSELFREYEKWCNDAGVGALSLTEFGKQMSGRFKKNRCKDGICYQGVGLFVEEDLASSTDRIRTQYME